MLGDWAFAQRGYGLILIQADGTVIAVEFNEFLRRIASGAVQADDLVLSQVLTEGKRRRAGDLRLFAMVRSGQVRTEGLPLREPEGVLAVGAEARALIRALEGETTSDSETLLRAIAQAVPAGLPGELLRAAAAALSGEPSDQLLRPAPKKPKSP
ncbi:MAG TPA: hypothetical protein VFB38_23680 [Chthonomonadaceae bacterium]|nr:hypothetical protein [Chthonomonadaceae bacterium]